MRQVVAPFTHDGAAVRARKDAFTGSFPVFEITRVPAAFGKGVGALAVEGAVFEFAHVLVAIGNRVGALAMLFIVFEFAGVPVAARPRFLAYALVVIPYSRAVRQRDGCAAPGVRGQK